MFAAIFLICLCTLIESAILILLRLAGKKGKCVFVKKKIDCFWDIERDSWLMPMPQRELIRCKAEYYFQYMAATGKSEM